MIVLKNYFDGKEGRKNQAMTRGCYAGRIGQILCG